METTLAEGLPAGDMDGMERAVDDRLEILGSLGEPIGAASSQMFEEALLSQQAAMSELREEFVALRTELAQRDRLLNVVSTELAQLESRMRELQEQTGPEFVRTGQPAGDMALRDRILADPLLLMMAATMLLLFLLLLLALFRPVRVRQPAGDAGSPAVPAAARAAGAPGAPERALQEPSETRAGTVAGAALAGAAIGTAATRTPADAPAADRATLGGVPSGEIDVDEGDDDVLADVDLYLAYGMNDQAITALNKAVESGTDTLEYRMRLLDAHAANNDAEAVRQAAADVRARLGPEDGKARAQVAAVEARFFGGQPDAAEHVPEVPDVDDGSGRTGAAEAAGNTAPDFGSVEFDAAEGPSPEMQSDTGQRAGNDEDEAHLLRFDVEGLGDASTRQADEPHAGDEGAGIPALDLPSQEGAEEGDGAASTEAAEGEGNDTSEVGMKLSLAEAFADLGDREGALALLEEIMPAATDRQREQVEAIRQRLGQEGAD
ncbi:putative transmembrane protein [Thioalkalivibrio nitratireducens DSM 14787]|uniref:Transmembrane protein n=1 Tax=Thioalkalivibrio nitratireducens (strain DSM 14787 / UNIQEM 213 / ALEN2) TaxID=1255043 RepID=L0DV91_THIND|nr:putative transmembrane protein [Thioalkalivibrio nitratireducens DSM 14787]